MIEYQLYEKRIERGGGLLNIYYKLRKKKTRFADIFKHIYNTDLIKDKIKVTIQQILYCNKKTKTRKNKNKEKQKKDRKEKKEALEREKKTTSNTT